MTGRCPRGHRITEVDFQTDGFGNVRLACRECEREASRPSPFRDGLRPACPLRRAGEEGPVCQDAFERAYARQRFPAPFARAVLLKVVAMNDPSLVPVIVRPLLTQGKALPTDRCIGCSLTERAAIELRQTYATTLHPEVDDALVRAHARGEYSAYIGAADAQDLDDAQQAYLRLIESGGLLDDEQDGLGQLLREAV